MKSLYLVVVTATISTSISAVFLRESSQDLRAQSLTLATPGGREVRITATPDGLEIVSPESSGRVQLIFAGEENLSLRMTAQESLFDVGVGAVSTLTLKDQGTKGGIASMWAGPYGGAAAFQSPENGYGVSINTQDIGRSTVTLRRLGKDRPQLQLELLEKGPKIIQTKAD